MIAAVASVGLTMLFLLGVLDCAIQDVIRNRAGADDVPSHPSLEAVGAWL